jgi:HAD superfamily hydrolase (TIGR01490 family)
MTTVAVFDFDGTITTQDSLWKFLKFSQSRARLYAGLLCISPVIILYLLKIISNDKAKELLFSCFFKRWSLQKFNSVCRQFSVQIEQMLRPDVLKILDKHKRNGHRIYIISASVENWIIPWAENHGIAGVLATQIEVDLSMRLTGKFKNKNCYGIEKVNRLSAILPDRKSYYLYAYGDSNGDKEMIDFADDGIFIKSSAH